MLFRSIVGTERVRILQLVNGTNQNLTASVAQLTAAPTTLAVAAQTYAITVSNSVTTALNTVSNNFLTLSNSATATTTNFNSFSNSAAAKLNGLGSLAKSNAVLLVNIPDAGSIAGRGSNDFYLASNPANYQTGSQVTNTISTAIAGLGTPTNNGTASFSVFFIPSFVLPATNFNGSVTIPIDCSKGCNFLLTEKCLSAVSTANASFVITNFSEGQEIKILISTASGSITHNLKPVTTISGMNFFGTASVSVGSGSTTFFNWLVMGTNIVFSGGAL